jgi:HSP20 family protein
MRSTFLVGVFPLVNLTEDRESYILRAEIPGVKAEDLAIKATANSVSISMETRQSS